MDNNTNTYYKDLLKNQKLTEDVLCEIIENVFDDKLIFNDIIKHQNVSEEFIEKYIDKIDLKYLVANKNLSEYFLKKYSKKIETYYLENIVNWYNCYVYPSGDKLFAFVEKYEKYIQWRYIRGDMMSLDFIDKYADKFDWSRTNIYYATFTDEFIDKYADKISWGRLYESQKLSDYIKDKYKKELSDFLPKKISIFKRFINFWKYDDYIVRC